MKKLFAISVLILSLNLAVFSAYSQAVLLEEAGSYFVGKPIEEGLQITWKVISKEQAEQIILEGGLSAMPLKGGKKIFMDKNNQNQQLKSYMDMPGFQQERKQADLIGKRMQLATTTGFISAPVGTYRPVLFILLIQGYLNDIGYEVPEDNVIGSKTVEAIKLAFGFDCRGLTGMQIARKTLKIMHEKPNVPKIYSIKIVSEKKPTQLYDKLSIKELNDKIRELQDTAKVDCGFEEICTNLKEDNATVSLSCSSSILGNVQITVSTEGSVNLSLKYPHKALDFVMEKDRKLKLRYSYAYD